MLTSELVIVSRVPFGAEQAVWTELFHQKSQGKMAVCRPKGQSKDLLEALNVTFKDLLCQSPRQEKTNLFICNLI